MNREGKRETESSEWPRGEDKREKESHGCNKRNLISGECDMSKETREMDRTKDWQMNSEQGHWGGKEGRKIVSS